MRLLHFDAQDRLILTDFRGKLIPPYAILSHRWSDSETLIEDIRNESYKEKEEGYQKLQFCAKQAAKDGLQYFWIDTCCIDRWDNNERSRAINSMFQWYQNAARCYVFLSDVSVSSATDASQRSSWEASFRGSDWFTRGWTLQELIAPVSVEFFSCEGQHIGDRTSLDQLIHDRTGIPLAALYNCPLDQFSMSERQRWAKNRITTEEEDIVYCLLGLLGVSMPTTYGEGKKSAQRRLQTEIETAGNTPSIIPFLRNESFVGREEQLAELEAKLFSNDQTTTTLAIVGPGGTGKSQLALEVAHRTRLDNKDCSVFWMDASEMGSLYRSYANVAQKLSVPGCSDDQADTKQVVKCCLAAISAQQCLLIYDNVEGTSLRRSDSSTTQGADLADFLPDSKLCSVIFTTTRSDTAEALAPRNVTALHKLTPDTALRMLQHRLTIPLLDAEQQDAMHLLSELSYLPLAVVQAAACMNAGHMTMHEYRSQLHKHTGLALEDSGDSSKEDKLLGSGLRDPVASTLFLSMDQIGSDYSFATDYLFFAACVDRKDIPLELLQAPSTQAREGAIRLLEKYGLVTRRPAESAFDLHRLVHQALRKRLKRRGWVEQWTRRSITQLLQVFPDDDHRNRSKWRRLIPHAKRALSHSPNDQEGMEEVDLAWKCAMTLHNDGQYSESERLLVRVMQTRRRVLGDEHPETLTSMDKLASAYYKQGRLRKAEELFKEVVDGRKSALGAEHVDTLSSTRSLASVFWHQGRWEETQELNTRLLETRTRILGKDHLDTMISLADLASTHKNQGQWEAAKALEVQVIETRKRVLGNEHPDTLTSVNDLASTYWNQGRWKEAEELQVQVMQSREKVLGEEHPATLTSVNDLASTYWNQGRWKEAEELQVQVMQSRKRVLGDEHPETLTSISNLALTYRNQGRWKEAEELHMQLMQTWKRVLGDEHPETLTSISNLASTYWNQGRWKEAEELQVQVMQSRKRVLGDGHPSTLACMAGLALTYLKQGRWEEAEELEAQVMQSGKRVLGEEHPDTLSIMNNLALTYRNQGRWKEAEELQVQVMQSRKRALGKDHPDTLTSMANLAFTLKLQARRDEALALMETCFQLRQQVLGEQHPDTQSSLDTLNSWRV